MFYGCGVNLVDFMVFCVEFIGGFILSLWKWLCEVIVGCVMGKLGVLVLVGSYKGVLSLKGKI